MEGHDLTIFRRPRANFARFRLAVPSNMRLWLFNCRTNGAGSCVNPGRDCPICHVWRSGPSYWIFYGPPISIDSRNATDVRDCFWTRAATKDGAGTGCRLGNREKTKQFRATDQLEGAASGL